MSPREKKLLIFFATAGFLVLNFLVFGFYKTKRLQVDREREQARQKLETAEMLPRQPRAGGRPDGVARRARTRARRQSGRPDQAPAALRDARRRPPASPSSPRNPFPPTPPKASHYHRAKIQITVSGTEEALYRWFDRLNMPDQLRIATIIRISPNNQDDTKIDCTATIEQWFVPLPPA